MYYRHREMFDELPYKLIKVTEHIVTYQTKRFRHLAVQPESEAAFYVWAELHNDQLPGVVIRNEENPDQPYGKNQPRNHHLTKGNASRLMVGRHAWYLRMSSAETLRTFLVWYAQQ